jgi:hypothetical protein
MAGATCRRAHVKTTVIRERKLPAFSLSIGDLEALWSHLTQTLFENDPSNISSRIQIHLSSEQLEFANLEQLKEYPRLPPRITNFNVRLSHSQKERDIMIRSQRRLGSRATVSAFAETAGWCAGAIEEVFSFTQSNKLWYSWFLSTPVLWALYLMAIAPAMTLLLTGGHPERVHPFFGDHPLVFTMVGLEPSTYLSSFGMPTSACCRPQSFALPTKKGLFKSTVQPLT